VGHDTYYDILGVSPTATPDEIKASHRNLIRRIHPDFDVPPALFRQVQEAYEALSDPRRRAAYDRFLKSGGGTVRTPSGDPNADWIQQAPSGAASRVRHAGAGSAAIRFEANSRKQKPTGASVFTSFSVRQPSGPLAIAGAALILLGSALADVGWPLILLGAIALIVAGVGGLGGRGEKERDAYQRSGMKAVDAMTGRQFEALLEHLFANKGYWVARIGGRGEFGADLLLNDAPGLTIVQARRWTGVVRRDAILQAAAARAHYGAARVLVVTSSDYSREAVAVANSNDVTLWNRADLAAELTAFRGDPVKWGVKRFSSELRAGSLMFLGFLAACFVALVAMSARSRALRPAKRRW
jgi:curved DNA-binding protein CbpA